MAIYRYIPMGRRLKTNREPETTMHVTYKVHDMIDAHRQKGETMSQTLDRLMEQYIQSQHDANIFRDAHRTQREKRQRAEEQLKDIARK